MTVRFTLNGRPVSVEADPSMPLLWVVRDLLGLKGTKYGCGRSMCGACSLHVDGELYRSCSLPVKYVEGSEVTTIEGLSAEGALHPVQAAWIEEGVPQCGYCQPGFMMAAARLLAEVPQPTDEQIDRNVTNLCRCGTHVRIRRAIHRAAAIQAGASGDEESES